MPDFQLLLRFVLVGGSTAMLYLGVPYWLVEGFGLQSTLASTIGLTVAICYNYPMHYHWTFSSEAPHGKAVVRYLVMCAGALVVNALLMQLGTALSALHYMFVQLLAAVAVTIWSISLSALWVYKGN